MFHLLKNIIGATVAKNNEADSLLLWDTIKSQVRENKIKSLQKEIDNLHDSLHSNPDDENFKIYADATAELEQLINEKTKGCIIRCKTKWYDEGEKPSKYFINLEKRNFNSKTTTSY